MIRPGRHRRDGVVDDAPGSSSEWCKVSRVGPDRLGLPPAFATARPEWTGQLTVASSPSLPRHRRQSLSCSATPRTRLGRSCGRRRRATAKRIVDQGASSNRAQGLPRSSAFSWSGTEATSWYGTEATLEVITKVTVWPRQSTAAGQPRRYAAPSALLRIPARFRRRQRRRVRRDRVVAREQPLAGHRDLTPVPRPTGPWVVARLWLGSRCPPSEDRYTIGAAPDRKSAVAPYVVRTQVVERLQRLVSRLPSLLLLVEASVTASRFLAVKGSGVRVPSAPPF